MARAHGGDALGEAVGRPLGGRVEVVVAEQRVCHLVRDDHRAGRQRPASAKGHGATDAQAQESDGRGRDSPVDGDMGAEAVAVDRVALRSDNVCGLVEGGEHQALAAGPSAGTLHLPRSKSNTRWAKLMS